MTDKPPMPQQGGSYIRQADGSLVLESRTEAVPTPIGIATAEAEAAADTRRPAKPRRPRAPAAPAAEPPPPAETTDLDTTGETA